jgi:cysteinyl-tRNA synthetase
MSKSLGNIITVREGLERYGADALRIFVLTAHYRAPLNYSEEALEGAKRAAERLRIAASLPGNEGSPADIVPAEFQRRFIEMMDDDLNTSGALATLFDLARDINRERDQGRATEPAQAMLRSLGSVLGLTLRERDAAFTAEPFIDLLVELRSDMRSARQFELGDKIRDRLADLGITLEDVPGGTRWRRRS